MQARLHILFASQASYGVIFRRGPSHRVCAIGWDRANDTFQVGQWLTGRIYERRGDLSPDGKYMIYFAMGAGRSKDNLYAWSAVSRAPYLKAIALYPQNSTWLGGGLFTGPRTYFLNGGCGDVHTESSEVARDTAFKAVGGVGAECLSVYFPRLLRDGWRLTTPAQRGQWLTIFEKDLPGGWILRKNAHAGFGGGEGHGAYWDAHELVHPASGAYIVCPDWNWADRDGARLVWAARGILYTGTPNVDGTIEPRLLRDFNGMQFENLIAPY